ncbi:hypothetical protein D9M70_582380 [compost metagenome]
MHDYGELVATQAEGAVRLAQAAAQAFGNADQQAIADLVAVAVVDFLEVVEVEEQHGGGFRTGPGCRNVPLQLLVEGLAIAQAGQSIAVGQVDQLVLIGHLFADIAHDAAVADDLACGVEGL